MHDKILSQITQFKELLRAVEEQQKPKRAQVANAQARVDRAKARLDAETKPIEASLRALREALADEQRRCIGPWIVGDRYRWMSGSLYLTYIGGSQPVLREFKDHNCNRVWLRVVTSGDPEWQARIWPRDGSSVYIELKLGPPLPGDKRAEWDRVRLLTEAKLVEIGYVIYPGEEKDPRS